MLDVIRRNSQSWVVKVIFGAIILTFVFWGANTVTSGSADVLAEVNGEAIYRNDLMRELRVQIQNIQINNPELGNLDEEQINALGMQLLVNMVRRSLLAQEARKLGLSVSDEEFSRAVTSLPDFQDASERFSQEIYKERIAALGMKVGQFEDSLAVDLLVDKLRDYVTSAASVDAAEARRVFDFEMERRVIEYLTFPTADYRDSVQPEESAVIAYYSENKDSYAEPAKADVDYLVFDMDVLAAQSGIGDEEVKKYYEERQSSFVEPARYHLRHILVSLPLALDTTDESVVEARKKAEDILARLRSGEPFAELAALYSDDAGTKAGGGDLGWVERGRIAPSLDLALPDLQVGAFSEPIRTANGFHILELVEVQPERAQSLEEVRDGILAQLKEDAAYANMGKTMSDVEDKIITGADFAAISEEYGVRPRHGGPIDLAALAETLGVEASALAGLPETPAGRMLPVIDTGRGFVLVRVNAYQPSFVPELEAVRARVVEALKDRESVKLASDAAAAAAKEIAASGGQLPATLAGKVKDSDPTTRFLGVLEVGFSPELAAAVFTAPQGQWLDRVFLVGDSAVLAKVKEVLPAEQRQWAEVSAAYTEGLNNARKGELFNVYLAQLQKNAEIEFLTDRIVGP